MGNFSYERGNYHDLWMSLWLVEAKMGQKGIAPGDTHQVFASRLVATGSCLLWGCLQGTIQSLKLTDSHFFFFSKHYFPSRLWTPQGQRVNLFCSLSHPTVHCLIPGRDVLEVMVTVITEVMTVFHIQISVTISGFFLLLLLLFLVLFHSTVSAPKLAFVWIL